MNTRLFVWLALLSLLTVSGTPAFAHDGHEHTVMGTVTMAAADHVMLKDTENKDVTVFVTRDTKVTRNKESIKAEQIGTGARVVVKAVEDKGRLMAQTIEVGVVAPAR